MRYELDDHEWAVIKPMLANKPRGIPRVNDRRVLNGIFWVLRSGGTLARSSGRHRNRSFGVAGEHRLKKRANRGEPLGAYDLITGPR